MRSSPIRIVTSVVGVMILIMVWLIFGPTKVGGSTTYSVTDGISMQPLLHKGDLVLVREQPAYRVGDIVLYQSPVLHTPVLHRILRIQNGNYFFKGDNNSFVDPGYATRGELVGGLWFHVSGVGAVVGWFGVPAHAALLAGVATLTIALAGTTNGRRRRRRHHHDHKSRRTKMAKTTSINVPSRSDPGGGRDPDRDIAARRPRPYFDGPTSTLVALAVSLLLAVVLLTTGFTQPTRRAGSLPGAFRQAGTFSYSAKPNAPTSVYPTGIVTTGDPIFPSLVDTVNVRFGYRFSSSLPHRVQGTVELRALVLSQTNTWSEVSTVAPSTEFIGDTASVSTDLPLAGLYTLLNSVTNESGAAGATYTVDIQPVVHLTGSVDGRPIKQKFSPVLPFAVTSSLLRLDVVAPAAPPGATYVPATADSSLAAALHPSDAGAIAHEVANELSVAKYHVPILALRVLGILLALVAGAVAVIHDRRRRRGHRPSDEERIARRTGALIVPVAALPPAAQATITVPDFAHLAGVAQFLERPILYAVQDGGQIYAVDDETRRYVTPGIDRRRRSAAAPDEQPPDEVTEASPASGPVGINSRRTQRSRSAIAARVGAGVVLLAVVATLTVSLTANSSVPPSHAGRVQIPGDANQASPVGCIGLSLTNLVTGSGTFSTAASNVLVLGTAGKDTINVTGQNDCIVGGGGKDRVTGRASDICIIGPTSGATYTTCVTKTK